ncbi:diguanylate cyclase/phosphodiesterase (GGDEF & EAL domains) with PAS/PAC sensor(s) [plant metagenome]|uniref:Diguanylate cyclase/phosphodiesterase (GGDEF & EAL domains) with PAS/PAC sensor(S) n=1 Tax=plant metagenome TaxID=1297885 RepID=A0A484Q3R9_9ZZZZ
MLDTFTLLVVSILLFEGLGVVLLLCWFVSRRGGSMLLGLCGGIPLLIALGLVPVWYFWSVHQISLQYLNMALLGTMLFVPCGVLLLLTIHFLRAESIVRAVRNTRSGHSVYALSQVVDMESLEDDLRAAMQSSDQLFVHYQPIFDSASRQLAGFEALLRWNHPERGLVPPMQFIPLAEQTELIVPLGAWVLENACAEAARWPESWYLSVNLSPIQLEKVQMVRDVRTVLDRTGLAPERLELEITEGVLVAAAGGEISRLAELRRAGVKVAIDDFGTGYSSLGYLHQLPFDTIKIDRSFVRDLETDPGAQAIVGTIVELSRRLEREIVAEGVETEGQYAALAALQCQRVQGWLLGKPMSAEDLHATFIEPLTHKEEEARSANWEEGMELPASS